MLGGEKERRPAPLGQAALTPSGPQAHLLSIIFFAQ